MEQNLFVYGTLIFPEILKKLTGEEINGVPAILENYKRYAIYDGDMARSYPAVIKENNERVEGILLLGIKQSVIDIIDFFEGNEFERSIVPVKAADNIYFASVYVWKESQHFKLKSDWDIEHFKKKYLRIYLNKVIPGTLDEYNIRSGKN